MLWTSLMGAVWLVLEPSLRSGERLHDARVRAAKAIRGDPLFWTMLALVAFCGMRALNTGIDLAYDPENSTWFMSKAAMPLMPGSAGEAGRLPFAAAVSAAVLVTGCRHSLGRSARLAFLLVASGLAGLAAVIAVVAVHTGAAAGAVAESELARSFAGFAFGVHLLCGLAAVDAVFERHWNAASPLLLFAVGGNAAGVMLFSPPYMAAFFAAAALVEFLYVFIHAWVKLQQPVQFKILVVCGLTVGAGWLLVSSLLPAEDFASRIAAFKSVKTLFPENFAEIRAMLSRVSFEGWISHLWAGTGVGSFPSVFRFHATPADWALLPRGSAAAASCWWQMLTERGLVGTVGVVLPFGFLSVTYARRLMLWPRAGGMPHPACLAGLLAAAAAVASGFFDGSLIRADALTALCSTVAISAASFPVKKEGESNGG